MCGIVAYVAPDRGGPGGGALERMNRLHQHRGPDNQSHVVLDEGRVGLAHARLSIMDLSAAAHQPMADASGKRWLVFNGEIYNFSALRTELEGLGERFRTGSDTEVLLAALACWGTDALERVEGMFAFVYVDTGEGFVLAARDRLGIKPLYAYEGGGVAAWASTVRPLTLMPGFSPDIDPVARFDVLTAKYVAAPRSIYRQIRKVLPGTWERVELSGRRTTGVFWTPEAWLDAGGPASESGWVDVLEAAAERSVRRQLVADVPVGVFLSGGVDSSLVAAMASRLKPGVKTFTAGFGVKAYDESDHARAVAAYLGTDHHEITVTPTEVMDALERVSRIYDEPFGDASAVPTYLVCRKAREHVTVALSGDGGDEQFFGYGRYHILARTIPLLRLWPDLLRRTAGVLTRGGPRSRLSHAVSALLAAPRGERLYTHAMLENFAVLAEVVGAGPRGTLWDSGLAERNALGYALARGSVEDGAMLGDLLNYMVDDCLVKVDRASMACSLEARVPLLDEDVLRVSLPMPLAMKWRRNKGKHALRQVLYRHVPKDLVDRPKMGFGVPLDRWLYGDMRDYTESVLTRDNLLTAGLDPDGVERIARDHRRGKVDHQYFLWPLVCYVAWHAGAGRMEGAE